MKKIAVIGAGLAGLITAYRLQQAGGCVEVFEAKGRVGGRVFSVESQGSPAELGGQNILDGGNAAHILTLVEEFKLETVAKKRVFDLKYFEGDAITDPKPRIKARSFTPEKLRETLSEISQTSHNMQDILTALFPDDDFLYKTFSMRLQGYEGLPPEKLSLRYVETLFYMLQGGLSLTHPNQEGEKVYFDHLMIKGGNSRLPEALAKQLPVHLNHPLKRIGKTEKGAYQLTFKNQETALFDFLVLAMPCTVYADIEFIPSVIDEKTLEAIKQIPYGQNSKIFVPVLPYEGELTQYGNERMVAFFHGYDTALGLYYIGSPSYFTPDSIQSHLEKDLTLLKAVYPLPATLAPAAYASDQNFKAYTGPVGYSWPNDPYAKGSFSAIGAGQEALFTDLTAYRQESVKSLFMPLDNRLFFTGEHTSINFDICGTMEAAAEAGERCARMIQNSSKEILDCFT